MKTWQSTRNVTPRRRAHTNTVITIVLSFLEYKLHTFITYYSEYYTGCNVPNAEKSSRNLAKKNISLESANTNKHQF